MVAAPVYVDAIAGLGAARGGGFSGKFAADADGGEKSGKAIFDIGVERGEGSDNRGEENVGDRPGDFGDEDDWGEKGSVGANSEGRCDETCERCKATWSVANWRLTCEVF